MSPPEVLRIKRKRNDDPVDALYIETQSKRRITGTVEQSYVFKRVNDNDEEAVRKKGIPEIVATLPGQENGYFERQKAEAKARQESTLNPSQPLPQTSSAEPRRFTLSKNANTSSRDQHSRSSRKVGGVTQIAIFVEQADRNQPQDEGAHADNGLAINIQGLDINGVRSRSSSPQKRPGASAAVPRRKAGYEVRTDGKDNEKLYEELQRFAEELKPKHAQEFDEKLRQNRVNHTNETQQTRDADMLDVDSGEYVYDTYVRHSTAKASSTMDTIINSSSGIGFLVINEEDEELWATFGSDDGDSERDWDSEQDDENAENYYGADYPEEEVQSDDEIGHGAYNYRHNGASDEEEYGSESDVWSSDERVVESGRHPWQVHNPDRIRIEDLDDEEDASA